MKKFLNARDIGILDICCDIELAGEELYLLFAELFAANLEIAALWRKTALEEGNHAAQFGLAKRLRIGVVEAVSVDMGKAERALAFVRSVLQHVRTAPPTLREALRLAIELEEKLADFHMDCVAKFTEQCYREMFTAMMEADEGHVRALRNLYLNLTQPAVAIRPAGA